LVNFFLVGIFVLMTGCGVSKQINYNYTPIQDVNEAKKIIQQVVLEQPGRNAPNSLNITNDYIQITLTITRRSAWTGGVAAVPVTKTLYFNNIKSAELYYQRGYYIVLVKEKGGEVKLRVITREEKKGQLLIDAVKTLEANYYAINLQEQH